MYADFLIIGAGITGLTIARETLKKGGKNIVILEKEPSLGKHASGRNSGVLHAGIYYSEGSLKAKFCLKGNFLLKEYCKQKGLSLLETGKVIVAKNETELRALNILYEQAIKNETKVKLIDEKELSHIEPNAKTFKLAIYSPYTAVIDPREVLRSIYEDLINTGKVKVLFNTAFKDLKGSKTVITTNGLIKFDFLINAAGAYADKVAACFGVGKDFKLVPFKGIYKKLRKKYASLVRGNIYPVPDVRNPFLGVHFTKSVNGEVYIGPTATPAFGRENYGIIKGIDKEAIGILFKDIVLFLKNSAFRNVALTEPKKYIFEFFYKDAKNLLKKLSPFWIEPSFKVGIRPQLVNWKKKELVMDFVVLKEGNSVHILNAVSPGFTSAMAFATFVVKKTFRGQVFTGC